MGLAVAEAVANAVEHGNAGRPSAAVRVDVVPTPGVLRVRVADEGAGVAPEAIGRAALPTDPLQQGGRGLYLIRELSDGVNASARGIAMDFRPREGE